MRPIGVPHWSSSAGMGILFWVKSLKCSTPTQTTLLSNQTEKAVRWYGRHDPRKTVSICTRLMPMIYLFKRDFHLFRRLSGGGLETSTSNLKFEERSFRQHVLRPTDVTNVLCRPCVLTIVPSVGVVVDYYKSFYCACFFPSIMGRLYLWSAYLLSCFNISRQSDKSNNLTLELHRTRSKGGKMDVEQGKEKKKKRRRFAGLSDCCCYG